MNGDENIDKEAMNSKTTHRAHEELQQYQKMIIMKYTWL